MLLESNDFVLCLGVGKAAERGVAHLFRLRDPINLITRPWQTGEKFSTGKWYKANKSKKYEQIDDIVRTTVIQKMDLMGNSQETMLELILPVFFPPDLSSLKQYGQAPVLPNRNALSIPICPLFGPENAEYLPAVSWDKEQICMYSDQLYGLKINLSYTIGSSPQWTHSKASQLKPWDYEEYQIVKQLCMESREEGHLLEGICPASNGVKNSPKICFMLNKQAKLTISICGGDKKGGSEFREYWPIELSFYEPPMIIALDCPQQSKQNSNNDLIVRKLPSTNLQFEIVYTGEEIGVENLADFPWLGCVTDQFHYLLDAQVKNKTFTTMQATMVFSLEKRSVAWVVVGIKDQGIPKMDGNDLLNDGMEDKTNLFQMEEPRMLKKSVASSISNLNISTPNSIAPKKFAIAVYMTNRVGLDGNDDDVGVFLFWDTKSEKFNRKCYAQFHKSLKFNVDDLLGKWFELEYLELPHKDYQITVFGYKKTKEYAVTRIRDGKCAQFCTPIRYVHVWHTTYPCDVTLANIDNFVLDKGWWPWLCRKCYPSLRDEKEGKGSHEEDEDLAMRMHQAYALEEGTSASIKEKQSSGGLIGHIPIIQKQPANPKSTDGLTIKVLAVLFAVRDTNGDAVFLTYNSKKKDIFTHRIYADPPEKIVGNPVIGRWYWLEYNSNVVLEDGHKINVITMENLIGNPPVETRVKYGIAQFNSRQFYILTWHGAEKHDRSVAEVSSDGPWWPNICFYCYPNVNANNVEMPIVVKKKEVKDAMVNSAKWATGANTVPVAKSTWATGANTVPVAKSTNRATGVNTIPAFNSSKWATGVNIAPIGMNMKKEEVKDVMANSSKWATGANTAPIGMKKEEVKDAMVNSSKRATGANTIPVAKSTPIVMTKEEVKDAVAKSNWTTKNEDSSFTDSSYEESETEEEISTINKDTNSNCSNKDGTSQMPNHRSFTPISTTTAASSRPPPILAVGNIFGSVKSSRSSTPINGTSMTSLNGNITNGQQNVQLNSTDEGTKQNEANQSSDKSQSIQLTGGFGMSRQRRHQQMLANSTPFRSNSPSTSKMGQN